MTNEEKERLYNALDEAKKTMLNQEWIGYNGAGSKEHPYLFFGSTNLYNEMASRMQNDEFQDKAGRWYKFYITDMKFEIDTNIKNLLRGDKNE